MNSLFIATFITFPPHKQTGNEIKILQICQMSLMTGVNSIAVPGYATHAKTVTFSGLLNSSLKY